VNPSIVGRQIHGKKVFPFHRMEELAARMHVHIGVLTVPASAAQEVADRMIQGGIMAIWNFTPVQIAAPAGIIIERAELSASLAGLTSRLRAALRA
jgi:redox-sensing transcriptional repressor